MSGPCTDCGGPDYQTLLARIAELEVALLAFHDSPAGDVSDLSARLEQAEAALATVTQQKDNQKANNLMLCDQMEQAQAELATERRKHDLDNDDWWRKFMEAHADLATCRSDLAAEAKDANEAVDSVVAKVKWYHAELEERDVTIKALRSLLAWPERTQKELRSVVLSARGSET